MPIDETEAIRRELLPEINQVTRDKAGDERPATDVRRDLEGYYGTVWNADELARDFIVHTYLAPITVVTRKSDNVMGSVLFTHSPRFYFEFEPGPKPEQKGETT